MESPPQPPRLLDQLRSLLRRKHYSLRTEEAYEGWVRRFILFHGKRHPKDMGAQEVEAFLSHLAVARQVSASTQNQAKAALLFLYRDLLEVQLPWLDGVTQAREKRRLPVVLTPGEVRSLLDQMAGQMGLVAALLYGTGLRLMEGLRLRVKDLDFEAMEITVRGGKGDKDRVTMLPERLVPMLRAQLQQVKARHERDVAEASVRSSCRMRWRRSTGVRRASRAGSGCFRRPTGRWTRARVRCGAITCMRRACKRPCGRPPCWRN
jgi:integrase